MLSMLSFKKKQNSLFKVNKIKKPRKILFNNNQNVQR